MGIDHPDDAHDPSPERPHPPPDHPRFEPRNRQEYYADRHATWEETAELSRWMWTEYKRRWPPEDHPPADRSKDEPGSWRSDTNRYLNPADNHQVETECDRIAKREQETISPTMRNIESQDPSRQLVGLEHCRKSRDRIKEKACDNEREYGLSLDEAVSFIPDTIRYTFQYEEARYTQGVHRDIARLKGQDFILEKLKNLWSDDRYKGINSQWTERGTGQRFEVQFHTRISLEAKQLTHDAYARQRTMQTDEFEEMVLEAFQKKVSAEVPVPPRATEIPDYKREADAR